MAAMLAEIRSRMLPPRPEADDEEDDPRAELIRRQEYEQIKTGAERLDEVPRVERELSSPGRTNLNWYVSMRILMRTSVAPLAMSHVLRRRNVY